MRIRTLFALCAATAAPLAAEEILVPGDQPTLREAVLNASPGDVIVVQTAAWQEGCTVDKPLTIVGDPVCYLRLNGWAEIGLTLDGPGQGAVTLVRVAMEYGTTDTDGRWALRGGGFDELHLIESRIDLRISGPTGTISFTYPAIDVSVPLVVLVDSFARGGNGGSDHCSPFQADGAAGILARGSTVILVDSEVLGGNGFVWYGCCVGCSCDLSVRGGSGGEGVVAEELITSGSIVAGGYGASWYSYPEGEDPYNPHGTPTYCGRKPDGVDRLAIESVILSDGDLTASASAIPLGGRWKLTWQPEPDRGCDDAPQACRGLLVGDFTGLRPPTRLLGGLFFLDRTTAQLFARLPLVPGEPRALHVPGSLALLGTRVTAQVLEPRGHFSRPVTGVLLP